MSRSTAKRITSGAPWITTAPEPKALLHPNLAEFYRKKVADLDTILANDEADPEAFRLIRSLVDEIILTPDDGAALRVDLKGDLAAILNMATSKKPADEVHGLEQVKLVAGARYQRYSPLSRCWILPLQGAPLPRLSAE